MDEQKPLSAIVADDHWVARAAIVALLRDIADGATIHEAETGTEVLALMKAQDRVDLLVLDLSMPGPEAWDTIAAAKAQHIGVKVVVMSMSERRADVLRGLEAGIAGYIPKSASPKDSEAMIRRVLGGEVALPQRLLVPDDQSSSNAFVDDAEIARLSAGVDHLTPRQREIFELVGKGATNADVATALDISVNTVRVHLQSICAKLDLRDGRQVRHLAARWRVKQAA